MRRNTTLTVMLMMGSLAAAVAAPELPADLATAAGRAAPSLAAAAHRVAAHRGHVESGPGQVRPEVSCKTDETEPYRRLHHGSLKLDPVCRPEAMT